jgi:hypothetical protein
MVLLTSSSQCRLESAWCRLIEEGDKFYRAALADDCGRSGGVEQSLSPHRVCASLLEVELKKRSI